MTIFFQDSDRVFLKKKEKEKIRDLVSGGFLSSNLTKRGLPPVQARTGLSQTKGHSPNIQICCLNNKTNLLGKY